MAVWWQASDAGDRLASIIPDIGRCMTFPLLITKQPSRVRPGRVGQEVLTRLLFLWPGSACAVYSNGLWIGG